MAEWRHKLLAISWHARGAEARAVQLAAECSVNLGKSGPAELRRWSNALPALESGLARVRESMPADPEQQQLDTWICRHLMTPGPDLLISDAQRRTLLGRGRDAARRARHSMQGLHAARVEMPVEAWDKLRRVTAAWKATTGLDTTRGEMLARIIDEHLQRAPMKATRAGRPPARVAAAIPEDLFSALEPAAAPLPSRKAQRRHKPLTNS